jgi:AraC-like DNA-binding protein
MLEDLPQRLGTIHRWTDLSLPNDHDWDFHTVPTVITCLSGIIRVQRPGGAQDIGPGSALVIAPGVWHRHQNLRHNSVCWMQGFLPAWSDLWIGTEGNRWFGRQATQPALRFVEHILEATSPDEHKTAFASLIGAVLADAKPDPGFGAEPVQRMVGSLWRRLHQGISVDDLVRVSGLGRAQAYRLFTEAYGISPKAALTEGRLLLATALLKNGLSVSETAQRSGWKSADTFSRAWRRRFGHAPSQLSTMK